MKPVGKILPKWKEIAHISSTRERLSALDSIARVWNPICYITRSRRCDLKTISEAKKTAATYQTEGEQDAYLRGFDRGYSCASRQVLSIGERIFTEEGYVTVTEDNKWDVVQSMAFDGESNARQYSPFEFTASEFNSKEDVSEYLWDAFDDGIVDGILANIQERISEDVSKAKE